MTYILFDIGGTKIKIGTSLDLKTIDKSKSINTPTNFKKGIKMMAETIKKLISKKPTAIAGGIRGLLNEEKTGILNDSAIPDWAGKSVIEELQKYFDVPIFLENDAAVAGLGEAVYGAGKELDIVAFHTISTGVGGVKIEDGEIDLASVGFEPGHQILDIDRTVLGDDITPTLENLVSGTALEERFGMKAYEIPQSDIIWDELAEYLAQGLHNTIMYWSPDVIVLGGSMITGDPRIEIDAIRKYTVETLDGFVTAPHITMAELGENAGLYGAMAILKKHL